MSSPAPFLNLRREPISHHADAPCGSGTGRLSGLQPSYAKFLGLGVRLMSESEALFGVLRQSADAGCVAAIERAVREASDRELCRINALVFAAKYGLDEGAPSPRSSTPRDWVCSNCPGTCSVPAAAASSTPAPRSRPSTARNTIAACARRATSRRSTKWSRVTFTVSPRLRRIAAHSPDTLPEAEYFRQIFWCSSNT